MCSVVCWIMVSGPHRLSVNSCPRISHLLKRLWSFGCAFPKQDPKRRTHSSVWKSLGRPGARSCVVSCSCQQKALMARCLCFPPQALPVWPLLPVLLPAVGAEEPRGDTLQWPALQVWLLRARLRRGHHAQQSHPDTHWGKALQVSAWGQ